MSLYTDFFFNSKSSIVAVECIEISHPSFSQTYRIVRNAIAGITVTHEDATVAVYTYYPARITPTGATDDLSQTMKVDLGDLGTAVPKEIDNILVAGTMLTKPVLKYRIYRSDSLAAPMFGPITYQVTTIDFSSEGCSLGAEAPQLNAASTGELYRLDRFPMLAGFL